jgi:cell division protein FtsL
VDGMPAFDVKKHFPDRPSDKIADGKYFKIFHRLVSLIGVPLIIGLISWLAITALSVRDDVRDIKNQITWELKNIHEEDKNVRAQLDLLWNRVYDIARRK